MMLFNFNLSKHDRNIAAEQEFSSRYLYLALKHCKSQQLCYEHEGIGRGLKVWKSTNSMYLN